MRTDVVEARHIKSGDRIFNSKATHPAFEWSRVRSVREVDTEWTVEGGQKVPGKAIEIDAGFITVKHPREGVWIIKGEAPSLQ
jgi:hypothetical protein